MELGAGDTPQVGGKAASLGRMLNDGLPVPTGFCITVEAYAQFIASCQEVSPLLFELEAIDPTQLDRIGNIAQRIRECLTELPVPPTVERAILTACEALEPDRPCAVRSSATAEDLPEASFAGQQDTFLNVCGPEAIVSAVRRCWVSLFTDRAVTYRTRNGVDPRRVAMAVVVQEMVPADASGVLFTTDPISGSPDRIVIEGSFGLGEAIVAGKVSPDRVVLNRTDLRLLEQYTSSKAVEVVANGTEGTREQPVAAARQQTPCLTEDLARQLARLALRAEQVFGCPQDVEWAVTAGRPFLLQSRPITTLTRKPAEGPRPKEDRTVWSNVNIGELLPDVATPMTWSVLKVAMKQLFGPFLKYLGIDLEMMIGLVAGRVYVNVNEFARFLKGMPTTGQLDLNKTFGGHQGSAAVPLPTIEVDSKPASVRRKIKSLIGLARLASQLLTHWSVKQGDTAIASFRTRVDRMARLDLASMPEDDLASFIRSNLGDTFPSIGDLGCAAVGMSFANTLYRICKKWLNDADGAVANRLLSGAGGMDSADAALDMYRLASWARAHSSVADILAGGSDFATIRGVLEQTEAGREFLANWEQFMIRHGHHTYSELDIHNPRWYEMPDYVLDMVRGHLAGQQTGDPLENLCLRGKERSRLLADCRKRLGPIKRLALGYVVTKAQRGLAIRENFKSELIRALAVLRRALLEMGDRLVRRGILSDRDDIFFLDLAEIDPMRQGQATFDVKAAVAARRAEYALNQTLTPPPVVVGRFEPNQAAPAPVVPAADVLRGLAVSPGVATGPARVILKPDASAKVLPGEILVAPFTDPGWTPYFLHAAAIVMDMGGLLSHGCIVAREYGLPAVVNVGPATRIIRTGQMIRVDGNLGVVTILNRECTR